MNRNVESHFANIPSIDIQRSIFDRSFTHKTSFNVGELIPFYVDQVLPGDTFKVKTSKVIRLQTLLTPVMDNLYLDTYYFFCPDYLAWVHEKEFFGENNESAWAPSVEYSVPVIVPPEGGFDTGTLADYMGLPIKTEWLATDPLAPSALPFRHYARICNEFFRDENLTDPLNIPTGDSNQQGTNGTGNYINDVVAGGPPFKVAKYHDYFTSCLPSAQKATDPVTFPLLSGSKAPVEPYDDMTPYVRDASLKWRNSVNGDPVTGVGVIGHSTVDTISGSTSVGTSGVYMQPANLWADLSTNVGAVSINELRLAFQLQRFYERNARGGLISVISGLHVKKIEEKIWKAA